MKIVIPNRGGFLNLSNKYFVTDIFMPYCETYDPVFRKSRFR
jgi:hypothetical protein